VRAKLLSVFITLFWVCMMSSLVVQQILPERRRAKSLLIEPDVLASQWADVHEWAWIRRGGETVGAMALSITQSFPEKGGKSTGYRVTQNGDVEIPILLFRQRVQFFLTVELTPEFTLSEFTASIRLQSLSAEISGFVLEEHLFYRVGPSGGEAIYGTIPLKRPLSLLSAVRPMIARQFSLVVGRTYPIDVIDPINNKSYGQARVVVAAREAIHFNGKDVAAYRLDTTFGGVTKRSWVANDGITLRRELWKDYVMEQGEKAEILRSFPALGRTLRVPVFDVLDFRQNASEQDSAVGTFIQPDVLNAIGQLMGSE